MRCVNYLDTGPPPKRKEPEVGTSWPKEKKNRLPNTDIKHQSDLAQAEASSLYLEWLGSNLPVSDRHIKFARVAYLKFLRTSKNEFRVRA